MMPERWLAQIRRDCALSAHASQTQSEAFAPVGLSQVEQLPWQGFPHQVPAGAAQPLVGLLLLGSVDVASGNPVACRSQQVAKEAQHLLTAFGEKVEGDRLPVEPDGAAVRVDDESCRR